LFEIAAAYLFRLATNHPFIDGDERAALACALVFLELNGVSIDAPDEELVEMVLRVATGEQSKAAAAVFSSDSALRRAGWSEKSAAALLAKLRAAPATTT
jgi:death-on-curing protein